MAGITDSTLVPSTRQPYHSYADKIAGIKDYGLEAPTPIQRRVIKPIVEGRHWFWYTNPSLTSATGKHMVLQAPAATGKASALAIACLQKINAESETVQALILQPTTEAATACHRKILSIGEPMGIDCMACLSGTSIAENIEDLQNGPQIVVGTPGRITDLIARSSFDARNLTLCIFDGVDDSLSGGHSELLQSIWNNLEESTQLVLSASKMSPEFVEIGKNMVRDGVNISVDA